MSIISKQEIYTVWSEYYNDHTLLKIFDNYEDAKAYRDEKNAKVNAQWGEDQHFKLYIESKWMQVRKEPTWDLDIDYPDYDQSRF